MAILSEQPTAPTFPSWPLNCLTFYQHLAEDYSRFVQALAGATDPAQAARAEGDYGISMMHDLAQAWYDLSLSPITAMAKAIASSPGSPGTEPAQAAANDPSAAKAG